MPRPDEPIAPGATPPDAVGRADSFSSAELSATANRGARFLVMFQVVSEGIAFLSVIAVARLISPREQGVAAVALVIPVLAYVLTFEGFGAALVQAAETSLERYRTATTLSFAAGLGIGGVTAALSATLGRLLFGHETASLMVLATPAFILAAATTVPRAKMMRRLDFKILGFIGAMQALATALATIAFAVAGLGPRALILGALAGLLVDMGLQWRYNPPVWPGFSRSASRDLVSFGSYASLNGLAAILSSNIDYIVLSLFLPPRLVGIYYRAFQFGALYQLKVTVIIQTMIFPLMSRARDMETFRHIRQRAVEINSLSALPLLGLLIVLAPNVVPLLYGPHWTAAIRPTQILTVAGMSLVLLSTAEAPAMALGRPRRVLVNITVFLVVYGASLAVAGRYGLIPACITAASVHVAFLLFSQHFLIDRVIGLPFHQFLLDAGPAMACTAAAMAVSAGLRLFLAPHLASVGVIAICGPVGAMTYVGVLWLVFPNTAWRQGRTIAGIARDRRL